jgi:hypothetical protein
MGAAVGAPMRSEFETHRADKGALRAIIGEAATIAIFEIARVGEILDVELNLDASNFT